MKKLAISCVLSMLAVASSSVFAADACTGTAGNGTAVASASDGTKFVRAGFTPKCSANVMAKYTDQTTTFAVASGSKKGKNTFVGNTAGGAVKPSGTACASSGCTDGQVGTALTVAEGMASS